MSTRFRENGSKNPIGDLSVNRKGEKKEEIFAFFSSRRWNHRQENIFPDACTNSDWEDEDFPVQSRGKSSRQSFHLDVQQV